MPMMQTDNHGLARSRVWRSASQALQVSEGRKEEAQAHMGISQTLPGRGSAALGEERRIGWSERD